MRNPVRERLRQGAVVLGTMAFEFNTTGLGQIAANAGAEYVIYDMEHSGWGIESIRMLMATTRPTSAVPMVRVAAAQYSLIAGALDAGALGIMVPMVESRAQAELIAQAAHYPPEGRRGCAFGVAHDGYEAGDLVATMREANASVLTIAQIETAAGVAAAGEIAAVDGIDVLWIGHVDLSVSLGIPGQFTHPSYLAAVERVLDACRLHGKVPGIMAGDVATARACIAQGFRAIAYSGDLWIYGQALAQGLGEIREQE